MRIDVKIDKKVDSRIDLPFEFTVVEQKTSNKTRKLYFPGVEVLVSVDKHESCPSSRD